MRALLRAAIALLLASILGPAHALAEKRVALIVGNGAYQNASTLANPPNDARDIAAALSGLGFQVISGTDLGSRAVGRFQAATTPVHQVPSGLRCGSRAWRHRAHPRDLHRLSKAFVCAGGLTASEEAEASLVWGRAAPTLESCD